MKILLLNQTFYPDVAATAQHAADLASALSARGHHVTVIAGRRAYGEPRRFLKRETWRGIDIIRLPYWNLGKSSRWRRVLDGATFFAACAWRMLALPRVDVVIALTSPPLIAALAALFVRLRGGSLICWVMDLNPDEAIAAGWMRQGSWATALCRAASRYSLRAASRIIVLDRFMKQRICAQGVPGDRVEVVPPWAHDRVVSYDPEGRRAFRKKHGFTNKFVVMYSGNHSPCHPLATLLEAARELVTRPEFMFCFVGGGAEFSKVKQYAARHQLPNVLCLPYQSLDGLSASLSAADLHVVVMGDAFVGIVHPCKVYNILRLGIPFLFVGPAESHITDLVPENARGHWFYQTQHGNPSGLAQPILDACQSASPRTRDEIRTGTAFSHDVLVPQLVAAIEQNLVPVSLLKNGDWLRCPKPDHSLNPSNRGRRRVDRVACHRFSTNL